MHITFIFAFMFESKGHKTKMFEKCLERAKMDVRACAFSPEYLRWQGRIPSGLFLFFLTLCFLIFFCREWTCDDRKKRKERTQSVSTRICIMCLEQRLLSLLTLQLAQLAALTRWRAGPLAYSLPCGSERTGSLSRARAPAGSSSDASRWCNRHSILSLSVSGEVEGCSGCLMGLHCQITCHHIIQQN